MNVKFIRNIVLSIVLWNNFFGFENLNFRKYQFRFRLIKFIKNICILFYWEMCINIFEINMVNSL